MSNRRVIKDCIPKKRKEYTAEGIVEYFEGLVEYMRKLGYEDPRDKRIAELETLLNEYKDAECRAVKLHGEALKRVEELEDENERLWAENKRLHESQIDLNTTFHKQGWNDATALYSKRIEELEAQVKLADALINGPDDDHMGMAMCLDGYYGECFTENLKEWDRLMEQNDD